MRSKNDATQENEVEFADIPKLLALAAEHDRVDILQDLIQRAKDHFQLDHATSHKATNEYILNQCLATKTSSSLSSEEETEKKYPDPFIPPLHIAISSGSVHASTCLLRMGADPSIRPVIGVFIGGENVVDEDREDDNKAGVEDAVSKEDIQEGKEKKIERSMDEEIDDDDESSEEEEDEYDSDDYEEYYEEYYSDEEDVSSHKQEETQKVIQTQPTLQKDGKENSSNSQLLEMQKVSESVELFVPEEWNALRKYHNVTAYELLQNTTLPKNKKRGIEHAFFAEALRAIGSEDASRLRSLLQSGMKAGNEADEENDDSDEKTLLEWAMDMNEDNPKSKCVLLLKHWGLSVNDEKEEDVKILSEPKESTKESTSSSQAIQSTTEIETSSLPPHSPSAFRVKTLQRKIEESQSLALSLTPILNDLMHENKICQTLIIGPSSETNGVSPLVTHVKTMKALIAQKEVEFQQYHTLWENAYDEENKLQNFFRRESKELKKDEVEELEAKVEAFMNSTNVPLEKKENAVETGSVSEKDLEDMIVLLASKLADCETKVRILRASLVDMSEENTRFLADLKRLGLSGAVRLARKLRQELVELENNSNEAKEQAEICQKRVQKWMLRLKVLRGDELQHRDADEEEEDDENYVVVGGEDLEDFAAEEYDEDEYTDSSGEYEEYTDDEEEDKNEEESPSKKITSGQSTEIVMRQENGFKLWELIWRIVGLGKNAAKKTKMNTYRAGREATGVMVI